MKIGGGKNVRGLTLWSCLVRTNLRLGTRSLAMPLSPAVAQPSPGGDAERHSIRERDLPHHRRGEPAFRQGHPMIDRRKDGAHDQACKQ